MVNDWLLSPRDHRLVTILPNLNRENCRIGGKFFWFMHHLHMLRHMWLEPLQAAAAASSSSSSSSFSFPMQLWTFLANHGTATCHHAYSKPAWIIGSLSQIKLKLHSSVLLWILHSKIQWLKSPLIPKKYIKKSTHIKRKNRIFTYLLHNIITLVPFKKTT